MSRTKDRTRDRCERILHELVMPNAPDSLHDIRAFTMASISGLPLGTSAAWDIVLAVGEAATNCVLHGQNCQAAHNVITMRIESAEAFVRIELCDAGPGFAVDVDGWPTPDLTSEKGRGIFIINTLMDKVEYPKIEGGTRCVLTKRFRSEG